MRSFVAGCKKHPVKPGAVYFPCNVIHCFNLFPSSDTAVGNDRLNEVRQQETTGPETKNVLFFLPLLGSFFQFLHTLLFVLWIRFGSSLVSVIFIVQTSCSFVD